MRSAWYFLLVFTFSRTPLALFSSELEEQFDELDLIDLYHHAPSDQKEAIMKEYKEMGMGQCLSSKRTSPINFKIDELIMVSFPELKFHGYEEMGKVSEEHTNNFTETLTGFHNWSVTPMISGGPLDGEYHLMQISWDRTGLAFMGNIYHYGHTVSGAKHSMEIYFIHTRNGISVREAEKIPGNVVNLAVFVTMKIFETDGQPAFMNDSSFLTPSENSFNFAPPDFFLPTDRQKYFHYNGTHSQPPCTGNVMWIVMAEPIQLGHSVLQTLLPSSNAEQSLHLLQPKIKSHPKVFFNRPDSVFPKEEDHLSVVSILLCGMAFLAFSAVAGILVFLFFKMRNAKKQNFDANNYDIGFHNNNFDSVVLITPNAIE